MSSASWADTGWVEIETEGYEWVVSFYAYSLAGLAMLTFISPMIVLSAPLIALLGPPTMAWWRGRYRTPRVGSIMFWWMMLGSALVLLAPLLAGAWGIAARASGPPTESFWLILISLLVAPFPLSLIAYRRRSEKEDCRVTPHDSPVKPAQRVDER